MDRGRYIYPSSRVSKGQPVQSDALSGGACPRGHFFSATHVHGANCAEDQELKTWVPIR